ncbi:L-type lectin-domain containing receptor kinase IX.2-like [Neltuma alba]|uniref:L-type lectin-domain containing receptor kinase IX.2-like n=1 Tax=Neltuma alba TaxID=207710 RepID=UPI0010A34142|nr:L-type lectin-domain containing receptor kinase IX.2-like [Prosopis alba]
MAASQYCNKPHSHHHHLLLLLPSLQFITPITLLFFLTCPSTLSSLSFSYDQFKQNDPTLKLEGDVYHDNGSLQLTRFERDSLGRVIYYKNLHLWDKTTGKVTDFSSHFSFIINSPNKTFNLGDGITFFLAAPNFPLPVPRDGSGIGLVSRYQLKDQNYTDLNPFVAVEFDTMKNDWDPPYDHVGIDVKSISTAYTTPWFSVKDGRIYDAVISYNSSSFNLTVSFDGYQNNNTKVEQSYNGIVNLTDVLPEWVEFGFSSATGDYFEIHTLCSWSFNSSLDMQDQNNENNTQNSKSKKGLIAGLSIGGGVLLICGIGLTICLMTWNIRRRRRRRERRRSMDGFDFELSMEIEFQNSTGPKKFPYKQLVKATYKFAKENKLGEGGFGGVYKGFVEELNSYVAIKKISQGSKQGVKEYASEVKIISQLRHKNLVWLIGWCHEYNDLILVYEFMQNGSLDSHLFKGKSLLAWGQRYNIAQGLASALLYLHEEWEQCVVHRDIKASNVMLDSNFNAKLGDFGLARLVDHGKGSKTTILAGTFGYMAPEYAAKGKASRETDVYSFGLVALEIACGRKSIEQNANEEQKDDPTLKLEGGVHCENGCLNLTELEQNSVGRVTYGENLHLWDEMTGKVTDFSSHFSFIINTQGKTTNLGDGITFFLAAPGFPLPDPRDGAGIGLVSRLQLKDPNYRKQHPFVAVEFDTFPNPDLDPPYDHVGIDINSLNRTYTKKWFTVKDGRKYDAVIKYDSGSFNLSVSFIGYENGSRIEQNFFHIVNLAFVLPEWVEFGFSSGTGYFRDEIHTLCSWSFSTCLDMEDQNNQSKIGLIKALSIGGGVLICGMGLFFFMIWRRRRGRRIGAFGFELISMEDEFQRMIGPNKFPYNQLVKATDNFTQENKLGEGGFGGVYKGFIEELNSYAAIKRISQGSKQGVKEYASEVKIISQLRHKNLVRLIGWCHEHNDLMLVYEFMQNGSLDSHLFKGKSLLTWEQRYNIAQGLALALYYLHEECEQCVVHRDIKASNVMLDPKFNAKLGDFGLARLVDHAKGYKTTDLAGTFGYMAPEYISKGKASRETDVYGFGVVALEIACGRKAIQFSANEERVLLVDWVWELHSGESVLEAADQRLCGDFSEQEMQRLMMVGLWCAHPDHIQRPPMRQVVQVLNFEAALPNLPSQKPALPNDSVGISDFIFSNSSSSASASRINRTLPLSDGFFTDSSQSSISPADPILHTH